MPYTLQKLADKVSGELRGNPNTMIERVAPLASAKKGDITFLGVSLLNQGQYEKYLGNTQASAVILDSQHADLCKTDMIVVPDPYYAYAVIAEVFRPITQVLPGVHPSAVVGEDTRVDPTSSVGPHVSLGSHVSIGPRTRIDAGCVIGEGVSIGADAHLHPRVCLGDRVRVGDRVLIYSGAVIGSEGFGWVPHQGTWVHIPQLGTVVIGDDVSIGANTTIDRGALADTVIGKGVKLDNLVDIGHGTTIGDHTIIAGSAAVAGSTTIGAHCMIGGGAAITAHVEIVDGVIITGTATISKSIRKSGRYSSGTGFFEHDDWKRNVAGFRHLHRLGQVLRGRTGRPREE